MRPVTNAPKKADPPKGGPKGPLLPLDVNDAPVVDLNGSAAGSSTTVAYHAGQPLTKIAPAGTVTDPDSTDFQGGSLRVGFVGVTANGTSTDQLAIITDTTVTLTGNDHSAQQQIKINGNVIGTLTGGRNGTDLVVSFHSSATPAQVQILLEHIGYANYSGAPSTLPRTVTFTLVDGDGTVNGGHDTGTASATITYASANANAAPVLTGDLAANVAEGGSYVITSADLSFSDSDDNPSGVTFTVSGLVNGTLKVNGFVATSFTGQQLASGAVTFQHDSSETGTASFNVVVEDGNEDGSAPVASTFHLTVSPVNDAPFVACDLFADVAEGGSYTITQADLWFSDPDDGPSGVTFTVSNQTNGTLKVNGVAATSFTGQQLADGLVTFQHDGSETSTAFFNVLVEDGNEDGSVPVSTGFNFAVSAVNDAPILTGDRSANFAEGGTYVITTADLGFTDPDDNASGVTFTVSNLVNGTVTVNGVAATSFTGQQLANGLVRFEHNGSETTTASFNVRVEDGNEDGSAPVASAFNFTVNPVNDAPVLTGDRSANLAEGGTYVITTADLGFTDPDDSASGVTFTISNLVNGTVTVNGVAATSFSGQQLLDGLVRFEHNGSETITASFNVRVEDGNEDGSAPVASAFNFTVNPVNDAPVLTGDRSATVAEGGFYVVTTADLGFSDPDDNASGVTFAVSNLANGTVTVNGVAATSFSGQQLLDGLVRFEHNGSETITASFNVVVEDGNEDGSAPVASAFNFTVNPVNDAPVLTGDRSANVAEGATYVVTAADLGFSDPDDSASGVTFTVSNPVNGTLKVNGIAATSFTGQQLANGLVTFQHDGSETSTASFNVLVEDGNEDGSAPVASAFNFTVNPVNDAPVLTGDRSANLDEGGFYVITTADLGFADPDDNASGVTFTVSSLVNGAVTVNGIAATSFSGQQLLDGLVRFEHNGSETITASFNVLVEDGNEDGSAPVASAFNFTVNPVNDAPVLTGDRSANVAEGGSYVITSADLGFTDPDDNASGVTFTISNLVNGTLKVNGVAATSFTGQQLANGLVTFEHDGSETLSASIDVLVEDGNEDGSAPVASTFSFAVSPVNDAPVLTGDLSADMAEGGVYVVTAADLGFSDPDDNASGVTFTISNPVNGTLKVNGVAATSFTGQQLASGLVTFAHDGSETTAASFNVRVEDGNEDGSAPVASTFSFAVSPVNDAPVLSGTLSADVVKNGSHKITASDLGFVDPDDVASDVTFTVSNQVNGTLKVNGVAATSFTGQQLLDGLVKFTHDGSNTATASFNVLVEDGNEDGSAAVASLFNLTVKPADIDLTTMPASQGFIIQGDAAWDYAGTSVSSAGDVNGDGFDDLIVGAPGGDNGGTDAGEAYIVFGKASGFGPIDLTSLSMSAGLIIQGDASQDRAGWSVSAAGDVNGDGIGDVIVGNNAGDDGGTNAGEAYVIFGRATGWPVSVIDLTSLPAQAGFIIQGDAAYDSAGYKVSAAGDVNGDGFDDLIVGAPNGDDGGNYAGEAYVVFGKASGFGTVDLTTFSASQGFVIQGDTVLDRAGWSVSTAGDVNGDGFDDLIVGAPFGDNGGTDAGEAYVLFGKATGFGVPSGGREVLDLTGLTPSSGFIIQGDSVIDETGKSVSTAGDVNGDGFDDLIVGAIWGDDGGTNAGEAYVVFGKASGFGTIDLTDLTASQGFIIQGDAADDQLGWSVSAAGDLNGDGYDDVIVGAPFGDNGGTDAGEAYIVFGKASGFGTAVGGRQIIDLSNLSFPDGFIIQGDAAGDQLGWSVSAAGDLNGDGFDDLIVGAPSGDNGGSNAGEAYVIFGSAFWGV